MAPGSVLGLAIVVGICLAGVVAQQYWANSGEDESSFWDYYPSAQASSEYGPIPRSGEQGQIYVAPHGALLYQSPYGVGPGFEYWAERGRDGWGDEGGKKKKKKKKKKKGKKKKGGDDHEGGWGPVSISTSGVQVGWKGWIPPVKGWGWGWFGEDNGHFKFTDYGNGWGKRQQPHFPDPGPPTIIKHKPIHQKVIKHHGWGGWGHGGGGGGGGGGGF